MITIRRRIRRSAGVKWRNKRGMAFSALAPCSVEKAKSLIWLFLEISVVDLIHSTFLKMRLSCASTQKAPPDARGNAKIACSSVAFSSLVLLPLVFFFGGKYHVMDLFVSQMWHAVNYCFPLLLCWSLRPFLQHNNNNVLIVTWRRLVATFHFVSIHILVDRYCIHPLVLCDSRDNSTVLLLQQ
jgi:hypothetical protein